MENIPKYKTPPEIASNLGFVLDPLNTHFIHKSMEDSRFHSEGIYYPDIPEVRNFITKLLRTFKPYEGYEMGRNLTTTTTTMKKEKLERIHKETEKELKEIHELLMKINEKLNHIIIKGEYYDK